MSEYEYGGAQFVDITREFMTATVCNYKEYLRTSVSVGGEVELAPTFELEDAVSSVDLMHSKMDRGLVKVKGMPLPVFRQHALWEVLPCMPLAMAKLPMETFLGFAARLETLVIGWMSGASAADTLMTCLVLQRIEALQEPTLIWLVSSTLKTCIILGDIIVQTNVVRSDEFLPSLFGIVDRKRDPHGDASLQWFLTHQKDIKERMGLKVWSECRKVALWLKLIRMVTLVELDYVQMLEILGELERLAPNEVEPLSNEQMLIEPLLSNMFTTGCIRRPFTLPTLKEASASWIDLIEKLTEAITMLARYPLFEDLSKFLLHFCSDETTITPSLVVDTVSLTCNDSGNHYGSKGNRLTAVLRSLTFAIMIKGEEVYGRLAAGQFAQHSLGLDGPNLRVEQILLDVLQITCHSPARQRRLLPKLLQVIHEFEMNDDDKDYKRAKEALLVIARQLGVWYVILGFGLELYEAYEFPEAHWFISRLTPIGTFIHTFASNQQNLNFELVQHNSPCLYDNIRRYRRWKCLEDLTMVSLDRLDAILTEEFINASHNNGQQVLEEYRQKGKGIDLMNDSKLKDDCCLEEKEGKKSNCDEKRVGLVATATTTLIVNPFKEYQRLFFEMYNEEKRREENRIEL